MFGGEPHRAARPRAHITPHAASHAASHADSSHIGALLAFIGGCTLGGLLLVGLLTLGVRHESSRRSTNDARRRRWALAAERHKQLLISIYDTETDLDTLLSCPALFAMSEPATLAYARACVGADTLSSRDCPAENERVDSFARAVDELAVAWDAALANARRIRLASFTDGERKRITLAVKLLSTAKDSAATEFERQACYQKAMAQLEGLVDLPKAAHEHLRLTCPTRAALAMPTVCT